MQLVPMPPAQRSTPVARKVPFRSAHASDRYVTPSVAVRRVGIRERAQLLITNPDMLHMSVLPVHGQFRRALKALCWWLPSRLLFASLHLSM